jgi:ComF family protein
MADQIWVPRCAACDARLDSASGAGLSSVFCEPCARSVVETGPARCPVCALPFDGTGAEHPCRDCILSPPPFSRAIAPYRYGGALATAIARLKYQPAHWLGGPLGDLLAASLPAARGVDVVMPVPLHYGRQRRRGFNQSALLAARLARALGVPLVTAALRRTRDTPSQARQGRAERLTSLEGAFAASARRLAPGSTVLLVDDVVTTTATMRAASEALVAAGVRRVDVIALARSA